MSQKNNVNPDHYKIEGRDRQGEDVLHEVNKQQYAQAQAKGKPKEPSFPASPQVENDPEADEMEETAKSGK
jgi:hypothetical protein